MRDVQYAGKTYRVSDAHPATDIMPWSLGGPAFAALVENMRAGGFDKMFPVIRHLVGPRLVAGRRRELAARVLGIDPVYKDVRWDDEEVAEHVKREDFHRRDLAASARAMVAVELAELMPRGGNQHTPKRKKEEGQICPSSAAEIAAEYGVGEKYVDAAAKVKRFAPALVSHVKEGRIKLYIAAKVADLTDADVAAIAAAADPQAEAKLRLQAHAAKAAADAATPPEPDEDDDPATDRPPPTTSPGECLKSAESVRRKLVAVRDELSALVASDYGDSVVNTSGGYTGTRLDATGRIVRYGELGPVEFGVPEYSCQALDEMLGFLGSLKVAFGRDDLEPRTRNKLPAAPWEQEDPNDPDEIAIA